MFEGFWSAMVAASMPMPCAVCTVRTFSGNSGNWYLVTLIG
jgi:hypothetical protein